MQRTSTAIESYGKILNCRFSYAIAELKRWLTYVELNKFLVRAKINTYASSGEDGEVVLEDGSRELSYKSGKWKYRDRHFGLNPFIGEEVVWMNGKIV